MADSPARNKGVDEAFAAYLRSCDAGEMHSREDFLSQFPEIADQLRELMTAADAIGRMTFTTENPQVTVDPADSRSEANPAADTVALHPRDSNDGDADPAVTLPLAHRQKGDRGPTLPYDLGDYQLLEVIGRGGMGVVYLAKQTMLDRMVAVKMIRSGILADESEVRRFYTEAQAAARLRHPGIVAVYQFGRRAGHHFFSMEHIRGTDLQRRINLAQLEPKQAARYVRDVARAIHHAHQKGVLHRDLKPANVLIDEHDQIHVTDFGLAKHLDSDSSVTGSGAAVGTPHYMAPEQAGGHSDRATHRSDIYSLGAILFAAVTGRPPIVADSVMQTLIQVVHKPAPPLRSVRADAPADLETIVAKCLEKPPAKRYATADKLAEDLDAYLQDRPIAARPRHRLIKIWHWLEDVPLVAALSGRRALESSVGHRRFQALLLCLVLLSPFLIAGLSLAWNRYRQEMPSRVRIAGGLTGGVYNSVSGRLGDRLMKAFAIEASVVPSDGSLENRRKLLAGEVDLAPMQASAIRGGNLCVVAPLFYEAVHVLARERTGIDAMDDLVGHSVAVGPLGSGSRQSAEMLFQSLDLTPEKVTRQVIAWPLLNTDVAPPAAVICSGVGSKLVSDLLTNGGWHLVPVPDAVNVALEHPTLRAMRVERGDYPAAGLPREGVQTVGTTAFLAARLDTPSELVTAALEALYEDAEATVKLIPKRRAAEWQGLAFHPAARRFYDQTRGD